METRTDVVTGRGNPLTLEGRGVVVGEPAPDFVAVDDGMKERRLSEFRGKTVILTTLPSLDTSVCDLHARAFNLRAAELSGDVQTIVVSMDLPLAQKRWCGAAGAERLLTLSDYRHHDFARNWGLRIRENGLLARAVYIIDRDGIIRYEEIVSEVSREPDYDAAIAAARQASGV